MDLVLFPARRATWGEGGLAWSHSYNDDWSHDLGAGVVYVRVPQIRDPFADVAVHAVLTYLTATGGEVALDVDRGVYTDVYVGDVLLRNSVGLRGSHPFGPQEAWTVGGGVWIRAQQFGVRGRYAREPPGRADRPQLC